MDRRSFLQLSSAGLAAGMVVPASLAAPSQSLQPHQPALLAWLRDEQQVRQIGRQYLERYPDEASRIILQQEIRQALRTSGIERRSREEFTRGETVQLKGWILARTEARQCALFAMSY